MKFKESINENKLQGKGLYDVRQGDYIEIGFEGSRYKEKVKIVKVTNTNRLQDQWGNIFDRNGMIYRRMGGRIKQISNKSKIIYARPVTQKQFDDDFKDIKVDFLRTFKWEKIDIKDLMKIIDSIPGWGQGNEKNISRF